MVKTARVPADYILPLYMNGLQGRMLRLPSSTRKRREILLIYGHHTSLERMWGLAEYMSRYGNVTIPDMPGFGGMESFYKIGEKPTLDNLADYLAAFVKLRYRNRRVTIMAISLGFAIVTRMLQRYPELAKKVDILISLSGMVNKNDFRWKRRNFIVFRYGSSLLSRRFPAALGQHIALRGPLIRATYRFVEKKHPKLRDANASERADRIAFEIHLWKINDLRTYMDSAVTMLKMDLGSRHVNLPVYHVAVDDDHYFDNLKVEQHMRRIYKDFHLIKTKLPAHMPTILASAKEAAPFIPPKIRQLLRQKV